MRPCNICCITRLIVGLVLSVIANQLVAAEEPLDTLVADYRAYELPFASKQFRLSIIKCPNGTVESEDDYKRLLGLVLNDPAIDKKHVWLEGRIRELRSEDVIVPANPTMDLLLQTSADYDYLPGEEFSVNPELALAIQCAERGWSNLASQLLKRSRQSVSSPRFRPHRASRNDRHELARVAWNYWCEQFCLQSNDRDKVLSRLTVIAKRIPEMSTRANLNILEDMKHTLETQRRLQSGHAQANRIETLIDSLVNLGFEGGMYEPLASLHSVKDQSNYRELIALKYEAVPTLLKHTRDFRMTYCVDSDRRGTWIVRIADIARDILNRLAKQELSYDILVREGRGTCVDQDHALTWWRSIQDPSKRQNLEPARKE